MRIEIDGNWGTGYKQDGMLYATQRIEEMLMVYTSHLYKTPINNTFLLAYEYLKVYRVVEEQYIDKAQLNNVMDEFLNSFSSDIVIKKHFTIDQIQYYVRKLSESSIPEQHRTMQYLVHIIADYPEWCVQTLIEAIRNPDCKKEIEKALRSYVPMIIGIGYHP